MFTAADFSFKVVKKQSVSAGAGASQVSVTNAVNINEIYARLPKNMRQSQYTAVSGQCLRHDPTGNGRYTEGVGVNAQIQGFDFVYGNSGISPTLILATLSERLDNAKQLNYPFCASFNNPSDAFVLSFFNAFRKLHADNPSDCDRYFGGIVINGIRVNMWYIMGTSNLAGTWAGMKMNFMRPNVNFGNVYNSNQRAA